jgi:hypothetical protein
MLVEGSVHVEQMVLLLGERISIVFESSFSPFCSPWHFSTSMSIRASENIFESPECSLVCPDVVLHLSVSQT